MSRRYEDDRFGAQSTLNQKDRNQKERNQGNKNQRAQNQKYQAEEVRKAPYQPGDIQRRQQAVQDSRRRNQPIYDVRSQRYQQETLAGDWQQDWNRTPYDDRNDKRFTAGQFVLILVIVTLILALAGMGVFWYTGRSSLRNPSGNGGVISQAGTDSEYSEIPDDNIVILDVSNEE